jgi:hypothetical protein
VEKVKEEVDLRLQEKNEGREHSRQDLNQLEVKIKARTLKQLGVNTPKDSVTTPK